MPNTSSDGLIVLRFERDRMFVATRRAMRLQYGDEWDAPAAPSNPVRRVRVEGGPVLLYPGDLLDAE